MCQIITAFTPVQVQHCRTAASGVCQVHASDKDKAFHTSSKVETTTMAQCPPKQTLKQTTDAEL